MRPVTVLAALLLVVACTATPDAPAGPDAADPPSPPGAYVAVGDSLATGAGAQRGYAERYAEHLDEAAGDEPVRFTNLARDGWASADLLNALREDPRFADALGAAGVVTVNIGGNDLLGAQVQVLAGECGGDACLHEAVDTFAEHWDAVLEELAALVPDQAVLVTMDVYNPFVAGLQALGVLDRLQPFLDAVNTTIRRSAEDRGMALASVHDAFNGDDGRRDPAAEGLIAPDRLHPSDEGHALIADLIAEAAGV